MAKENRKTAEKTLLLNLLGPVMTVELLIAFPLQRF